MKHLIVIGMDKTTRDITAKVLDVYDDLLQVYLAKDEDHALAISTRVKPDLLVADLSDPENDNLELLHHIKKSFPDLPIIVILESDRPAHEIKVEYPGITEYLSKPLDTDKLTERIFRSLSIYLGGSFHGITVASFLQLIEMEEKTCFIRVRQKRQVGYLHFHKGTLITAETGAVENEDAAYEILGWEAPTVEIFDSDKKRERRIHSPLINILFESFKRNGGPTPGPVRKKIRRKKKDHGPDLRSGLESGTRLHLKLENNKGTLKSSYIGMKPQEFLIISMPTAMDAILTAPLEGSEVVVNYLFNGVIFAFKSSILSVARDPFHLLYLEYPPKVQQRYIRSQKRVQCLIPATIEGGLGTTGVSIIDINTRGCGCLLQKTDSDPPLRLVTEEAVQLLCRFPGVAGEVALSGIIKNRRTTGQGTVLGIAFPKKLKPEIQNILTDYLLLAEKSD